METEAKQEFLGVGILIIILLCFVIPALLYGRAQTRDNLRVEDITNLKRAVEAYYNVAKTYPTPPLENNNACTSSNDVSSWFFGPSSPLIKSQIVDVLPHDLSESAERYYSYCVTSPGGYYLEAFLEVPRDDEIGFDEDEQRKFDYRIVNHEGFTLYRVCGGTELQCKNSNVD